MKTGFRQVMKRTLAWVLSLAMVFGLITVYPSTEVKAGEEGVMVLHYYYTGDAGTPALTVGNGVDFEIEDEDADFSYYGRSAYFMDADEENGDGWYTFSFTYEVISALYSALQTALDSGALEPYLQIIASPDGTDAVWDDEAGEATDTSTFLENISLYDDNDVSVFDEYFIPCAEMGYDVYAAYDLQTALSVEYEGQGTRWFVDSEDYEYGYDDGDDFVSLTAKEALLRDIELTQELASICDYYIHGGQLDDTSTWTYSEGIFDSAWGTPVIMTESETEGVYYINLGCAEKGNIYGFTVYGSPMIYGGWQGTEWNNTVVSNAQFTALASAYVQIEVNAEAGTYTVSYYADAECTEPAEIVSETTTFYYYYTGSDVPTLAFNTPIDDLTSVGTYWARTAYAMTAVSGYDYWYSFELLDSYGDFQIVANPSGEDDDSSIWLANFQSTDNYSTIDFDSDENVYYRGRMFTSISEALAYTDWDYYISGSNADYDMESEYNGTSNNIFTNYWSAPIGTWDNNGTTEYYKDESNENWADKMTETSTGYEVILPNKAVEGTTYAFNIYVEKEWNENYYKDAQTFQALTDGYVKISLNTSTGKYSVTYYSDAECTEQISVTETTTRFWVYYTGQQRTRVCIVFNGNMESDLSSSDVYNTYWGNNAYLMTRELSNNSYTGWYYFDVKTSYGSFQIVANPQGESEDAGDTEDKSGTIWAYNVYDDDYSSIFTGTPYMYRGKLFASKAKATAYTGWNVYIAGGVSVSSEPADSKKASYKGIFSNFWATSNTPHLNDDGSVALGDDGNPYYDDEWADQMSGSYSSGTYTYKSANKAVKGTSYTFGVYYEQSWNDLVKSGSFTASVSGYVKITVNVKTATYTVKYYSDAACTKQIALSKPTGLTVKSAGTTGYGKVKLSWTKVTNATKYYVYANGTKIATTTTNSYTYTKATAGKTIKYTVKAVDGTGALATSSASASKSVYVPKAVTSSKVKVVRNTSGTVKISWNKVSGATGYIIQRSTKKSSGFKTVKTITKASTTSWTDKNSTVKKGKKVYYYRVIAYKKVGSVKVLSKNATTKYITPAKVSIKSSVKNLSGKKAKVSWKKSVGVTGYQVMYATNKTFTKNKKTKTVAKASATSLTISKLKKGKTYYFKVRAYKTISGKKVYGAWSKVVKKKITK